MYMFSLITIFICIISILIIMGVVFFLVPNKFLSIDNFEPTPRGKNLTSAPRGKNPYNPWGRVFEPSNISPLKKPSDQQGQHFRRPDCQTHENDFGCPLFTKSNIDYNLKWDSAWDLKDRSQPRSAWDLKDRSQPRSAWDLKDRSPEIACLFMTTSNINFPLLWNEWLKSAQGVLKGYVHTSEENANINFNAERVPYRDSEHHDIVPPMISLITEALKTKTIRGGYFITGACIPTKSVAHVYKTLKDSDSILFFANENLDKSIYCSYLTRDAMEYIIKRYEDKKTGYGHTKTLSNGGNDELLIPQLLKESNLPTIHRQLVFVCIPHNCVKTFYGGKDNDGSHTYSKPEENEHFHLFGSISLKFYTHLLQDQSILARKFSPDCKITQGETDTKDLLEDELLKDIF